MISSRERSYLSVLLGALGMFTAGATLFSQPPMVGTLTLSETVEEAPPVSSPESGVRSPKSLERPAAAVVQGPAGGSAPMTRRVRKTRSRTRDSRGPRPDPAPSVPIPFRELERYVLPWRSSPGGVGDPREPAFPEPAWDGAGDRARDGPGSWNHPDAGSGRVASADRGPAGVPAPGPSGPGGASRVRDPTPAEVMTGLPLNGLVLGRRIRVARLQGERLREGETFDVRGGRVTRPSRGAVGAFQLFRIDRNRVLLRHLASGQEVHRPYR